MEIIFILFIVFFLIGYVSAAWEIAGRLTGNVILQAIVFCLLFPNFWLVFILWAIMPSNKKNR